MGKFSRMADTEARARTYHSCRKECEMVVEPQQTSLRAIAGAGDVYPHHSVCDATQPQVFQMIPALAAKVSKVLKICKKSERCDIVKPSKPKLPEFLPTFQSSISRMSSGEDADTAWHLALAPGHRVQSRDNFRATVRFVGKVDGATPEEGWIGIEWDAEGRGKHNGTAKGKRYFECRDGYGSFVRAETMLLEPTSFKVHNFVLSRRFALRTE